MPDPKCGLPRISNLKTAKQIGVTIPANVLARADRVIDALVNGSRYGTNVKMMVGFDRRH